MCGASKRAKTFNQRVKDFMQHWSRAHYDLEWSEDIRTP
jgi:hypothetical protein